MGALDAESGEHKPSLNLSHAAPSKSHDLPEQILAMELEDITDLLGRVKGRFVGAGQRIKGIRGQNGLKAVDRAVRRNRMRAVRSLAGGSLMGYRTFWNRARFQSVKGEEDRVASPPCPLHLDRSPPAPGTYGSRQ